MARIKTGHPRTKINRSTSNPQYLYDTDDAFRGAFDEAVDRMRAMNMTYITTPEDEDAGALQALTQLHAAVEMGTLELYGGRYNSFRTSDVATQDTDHVHQTHTAYQLRADREA